MNLLLFETSPGHVLPIGEHPPVGPDPSHTGDSRWQRLKQQVLDAYRKLKDQFDYWEGLCADLRHADGLRVVHPSSLSADDAQKKLRDFLDSSYSKHGRWMVVDGVLAGLGAILTPILGPNVFFFYPAVRALSHYFARAGADRASKMAPSFVEDARLDRLQSCAGDLERCQELITELEGSYNLENLATILKNLRKK